MHGEYRSAVSVDVKWQRASLGGLEMPSRRMRQRVQRRRQCRGVADKMNEAAGA